VAAALIISKTLRRPGGGVDNKQLTGVGDMRVNLQKRRGRKA